MADSVRRPRAYMAQFGTTHLHLRNPWVAAFWSFAFPGCGHLMLGRLVKGLLLIVWELVVNTNAHVNLGILYSLIGDFNKARSALNPRWLLLYIPLYVFAIWDSYRGAVDANKMYLLADRENGPVPRVIVKEWDINPLNKRTPWVAGVLALLTPGLGHLYVHKTLTGLFFVAWTMVVIWASHALNAVHFTMVGHFGAAAKVLNMQWLMYLPSIYGFVLHDAYATAVEYNRLYEKVQTRHLRLHYQSPRFRMPL